MMVAAESQATDIYQRSNLTRLQLLFWVGQRLRPEAPLFNAIQTFTIAGEVDPSRFQSAFQCLLDHSDAMRTVFEEKDGVPQQRVTAAIPNALEFIDLSNASDPETAFQGWLHQRRVTPINLEERTFDSALIKIAADRFVWYLNQHHIMTDASSSYLAFERLAQFYQSSSAEQVMSESDQAFADYLRYERAYRNSAQYARAAAYWDKKLTPRPEPIRFFGQQPARKSSQVQRVSYDLGIERSKKIREVARRKEIFTVSDELSLFSIFAALFYAQLHALSGSRRLGVLVPVHNRFSPTFKKTMGLVMEYCPFQVEVTTEDSFGSLIKKVQAETRETFNHYQYGSGLSLQDQAFDVIFNMYQVPAFQLCGAPVKAERVYPGYGSERLALHVNDLASNGKFELHFDFSCDAFSEEQREQVIQNYVQIIDAFLKDITQCMGDIAALQSKWIVPSLESADLSAQIQSASIASRGASEREVVAPRNEMERQLIQIWEQVLGIHPIGVRDNFFDLGGSSWMAVRLFAEIEKLMGVPVPLRMLIQAGTVEQLAEQLRQQQEPTVWSPLVVIQSRGAKRPFFCVHGAGGHILLFDKVARHLGEDRPFFAFQAQGLEEGQKPLTRIEDMAAYYVKVLREAQPEGPYLLGGYSMGGMVAYEMARQLQAQSQKVGMLAILDVPAQSPNLAYLRNFSDQIGALLRMSSEKRLQLFLRLRNYVFRISHFGRLKFSGKIVYIRGKLGRGRNAAKADSKPIDILHEDAVELDNGTNVDSQARKRIRRLSAINEKAFEAYIPGRYKGRVAVIRSAKGYTGDRSKDYSPDPYIGWGRVISGTIETYEVPGDHNEMIREPHVKVLADHLRTCLDNAEL